MTDTANQIAKYRTLDTYVDVSSTLWAKGAEIEMRCWPNRAYLLEPLNEAARLVFAYHQKHYNTAFKIPATPYTGENNALFLPEPQNMPLWRVPRDGFVMGEQAFVVSPLASRSWPEPGVTPINHTAKAVAAYHAQHAGNPRLPAYGWDVDGACVNTIEHAAGVISGRATAEDRAATRRAAMPGHTPLDTGGRVTLAMLRNLGGDGDMSKTKPFTARDLGVA